MSTNDFRKYSDYEYIEDYNNNSTARKELREHRKMKRMRNALRARNIDELLDPDDYER
jgi:hypothetical protein